MIPTGAGRTAFSVVTPVDRPAAKDDRGTWVLMGRGLKMDWLRRLLPARSRSNSQQASKTESVAPAIADESTISQQYKSGQTALRQGRYALAVDLLKQVVGSGVASADAHIGLGFALTEMRQYKAAVEVLRSALSLDNESADGHYLIGVALLNTGEPAAAAAHLQTATALQPDLLVARRDLGRALHESNRSDDALAVLKAGVSIAPDFVEFHIFLGNVYAGRGDAHSAILSYEAAVQLDEANAAAYSNMAPACLTLGDYEGAADAARKALALDPLLHMARSNLLVALSCNPNVSAQTYLAEAKLYGELVTTQAKSSLFAAGSITQVAANAADRMLRIGFVSGDLHSHPVGYFLESLVTAWNPRGMTRVAYDNGSRSDALTARLKSNFDCWHEVAHLNDNELSVLIHRDQIDVLIDLSGHTAKNRLPVFARRPAALQVSWLGYWASTGLPGMDFILADAVSTPAEQKQHFSERVAYLPDTRMCFSSPVDSDVPLFDPPMATLGHPTFGSFQRITKINNHTMSLWGRVMKELPGSRLRLQAVNVTAEPLRSMLLERLAAAGVPTSFVDLVEAGSRRDYLEAHGAVDMVLDTFPHTGATTTCEALWMGVPTVTLAGHSMLSRQGASLLSAVGLPDWIARDEPEFVTMAVRQANDLAGLKRLRATLRDRLMTSPLTDAKRFANAFQSLISSLNSSDRH